jgi:hypothetical protein
MPAGQLGLERWIGLILAAVRALVVVGGKSIIVQHFAIHRLAVYSASAMAATPSPVTCKFGPVPVSR